MDGRLVFCGNESFTELEVSQAAGRFYQRSVFLMARTKHRPRSAAQAYARSGNQRASVFFRVGTGGRPSRGRLRSEGEAHMPVPTAKVQLRPYLQIVAPPQLDPPPAVHP